MIGFEIRKLIRSRRPWIAVFAQVLFLALMLFGFYTYARAESGGDVDFRYTFENESYFNGLIFALHAFYFGTLLVLPIFAATEGGAQIAGETQARTMLQLLGRPVTRRKLFVTKFAVAAAYLMGLAALLLGVSLLIGLVAVGWGEMRLYPGVLQLTERRQILSQDEALWRFFLVWPAATLSLLTPLALAFLLSSWMRSAVNAVGAAVSTYLVLYVTSEIHFFEELRPWLFTTYSSYWRGLFQEQVDWSGVLRDAGRLTTFTLLFLAFAFRRFRRREEA